jgi:ribonuclease-3
MSGGRRKDALLADVLEALVGAIFVDGGVSAAGDFIQLALGDELEKVTPIAAAESDYKTMLQEKLQAERRTAPKYAVVEAVGPPHRRTFHVEVSWDGGSVRAQGRSIKTAEAAAAREALVLMRTDAKEA